MNRKGDFIPAIVDFISSLGFLFAMIYLIVVLQFSHAGFDADISSSFTSTTGFITLRTLLNEEVGFEGGNASFGDLLTYYATHTDRYGPLGEAIEGNLSSITSSMEFYNVNLSMWRGSSLELVIKPKQSFKCEPVSGRLMLAPLGPVEPFSKRVYQRPLTVELSYCG